MEKESASIGRFRNHVHLFGEYAKRDVEKVVVAVSCLCSEGSMPMEPFFDWSMQKLESGFSIDEVVQELKDGDGF